MQLTSYEKELQQSLSKERSRTHELRERIEELEAELEVKNALIDEMIESWEIGYARPGAGSLSFYLEPVINNMRKAREGK